MEETTLTFRNGILLTLLVLIPLFIVLAMRSEWLSRRTLENFLGNRMVQRLASSVSWPLRRWRTGLLAAGIALVVVALAGPQYGYITLDREVTGIDVLLAIDTSKSMLANDLQPHRLLRAKLSALDVVKGLRGDRVGLIAFAGGAFLQAPMTVDHGAVRASIQELDANIIPTGGTNVEDAVDLAMEAFGKGESGSRALVIYSDGEEWTANASALATQARDNNITIFTIGVGTETGSPITLRDQFGRQMYHRDSQGQIVHSKLAEGFLRELAAQSNGQYFHLATNPDIATQLLAEFETMTKRSSDITLTEPLDRFQWPLALGIALLIVAFTISGRRETATNRNSPVQRNTPAKPKVYIEPKTERRPIANNVGLIIVGLLALGLLVPTPPVHAQDHPLMAARELQDQGKYLEAYAEYMNFLEEAGDQYPYEDRVQYNAGSAAYRAGQYAAAVDSFSQSLLSESPEIQEKSQYNLANALYRKGEADLHSAKGKSPDLDAVRQGWESAISHYEGALKTNPDNAEAKRNMEIVQTRLEELKQQQEEQEDSEESQEQQNQDEEQQDEESGEQNEKEQEGEQEQQQEQQSDPEEEGEEQQQEPGEDQKKGEPDDAPGDQQNQEPPQDPDAEQPRENEEQAANQEQQQEGQQGSGDPEQEEEGQRGEEEEQPGQQGEPQEEETEEPSPGAGDDPLENEQDAEEGEEDQPENPAVDGQPQEERPEQAGADDFQLQNPAEGGESDAGAGDKTMATATLDPNQMSEEQARALLESLESEEQRVPLLETRRARRSNTRDW